MSATLGTRALVTGASGFIGSHLGRRLARNGNEVHGVSRAARLPSSELQWHQVDLTDIAAVRGLMERVRPDVVYHLASHVMGAPDIAHVLPAFHANLETTVNLLVACAEVRCRRLVLTGSLVEPDGSGAERIPSSPYAASKWAAADYARMFHQLYGLPVVVARVFMVYGPGQRDRSKLVPWAIEQLLSGRPVSIANPRRSIDWIHVDDVVSGLMAIADAQGIDGDSVDLGSGQLISTRELIEKLVELVGAEAEVSFMAGSDRPFEPVRAANVAASFEKVGWKPRVGLTDGLKGTIEWYADAERG